VTSPAVPKTDKKKLDSKRAWGETRALMAQHKRSLAIGFSLMIVNRLTGMVLPASSKWLIDEVIGKQRGDLLLPLALAALAATVIQAATGYGLAQVVSIAAQRAITEMRKDVQKHVLRLPVSYFDSTKTGILISRIMTDAEGVRNLVGTGIIQLVGGHPLLAQRQAHHQHAGRARGLRRDDGGRIQASPPDLPRARPDQRRGDGTTRRDGRRHPHREGLHGGGARGDHLR
jgi:hypothetical protein